MSDENGLLRLILHCCFYSVFNFLFQCDIFAALSRIETRRPRSSKHNQPQKLNNQPQINNFIQNNNKNFNSLQLPTQHHLKIQFQLQRKILNTEQRFYTEKKCKSRRLYFICSPKNCICARNV